MLRWQLEVEGIGNDRAPRPYFQRLTKAGSHPASKIPHASSRAWPYLVFLRVRFAVSGVARLLGLCGGEDSYLWII